MVLESEVFHLLNQRAFEFLLHRWRHGDTVQAQVKRRQVVVPADEEGPMEGEEICGWT